MKLFVASDLHSYYNEFKQELDSKGFESNNPEHLLVICGDVFDRGPGSQDMFEFLNGLNNVVLVKGNHEDLMEEVWARGYCLRHDQSNGTLRTINDLYYGSCFDTQGYETFDAVKLSERLLRPFFDKFVDYFETKNYIFVHGWIPCDKWEDTPGKPWYQQNRTFRYDPNWRNATEIEWQAARWINGINAGYVVSPRILEPDKTIVCGHWHCSYGHYIRAVRDAMRSGKTPFDVETSEFEENAIFSPFEEAGILAIDACTAHSHKVNVIVLEDDLLEEKNLVCN